MSTDSPVFNSKGPELDIILWSIGSMLIHPLLVTGLPEYIKIGLTPAQSSPKTVPNVQLQGSIGIPCFPLPPIW